MVRYAWLSQAYFFIRSAVNIAEWHVCQAKVKSDATRILQGSSSRVTEINTNYDCEVITEVSYIYCPSMRM